MKSRRNSHIQQKVLFHQDNAPSHPIIVALAKMKEFKFELLPHWPYLPYLAPIDFYLFPNLKKWFSGKRFTDYNQVSDTVNGYFEDINNLAYQSGIIALEHRWKKYIELNGDYVEK